ncbi:Conserved_hypothetical protein [Hexamita inflata]|uniref:Uncharacterized protein n=1 Tax=Hexamita inflata TaxID=28002 RepID=A0AA86PZU3_9EUKA|nr:Conserved hypothetical protein [Hexamita inflata]
MLSKKQLQFKKMSSSQNKNLKIHVQTSQNFLKKIEDSSMYTGEEQQESEIDNEQVEQKLDQVVNEEQQSPCNVSEHTKSQLQKENTKDINEEYETSPSLSVAQIQPQEELIKQNLKSLNINPKNYPLRYLACIHRALTNHKQQIYDVIQAMFSQATQFTSTFEQEAHENKFARLIQQYARLQIVSSTSLVNTLNQLLTILQTPPPVALEVDYIPYDPKIALPKYFKITKQNSLGRNQKRIIKFTTISLINVDGDLNNVNGEKKKFGKPPVAKNELFGDNILAIKIDKLQPIIDLSTELNGERSKRAYICENMVIRDQILGEIFDLCYWKGPKLEFKGYCKDQQVTLKLTKDSIIKLQDDKIVADYHYCRLKVEKVGIILHLIFTTDGESIDDEIIMNEGQHELFLQEYHKLNKTYQTQDEPDLDKL